MFDIHHSHDCCSPQYMCIQVPPDKEKLEKHAKFTLIVAGGDKIVHKDEWARWSFAHELSCHYDDTGELCFYIPHHTPHGSPNAISAYRFYASRMIDPKDKTYVTFMLHRFTTYMIYVLHYIIYTLCHIFPMVENFSPFFPNVQALIKLWN